MRDGEIASEHDHAVGRLLAEARGKARLSQTEVARRMGYAQSRVAKLETGTRRLLFSEAISLAELYHASLDDFVPRSEGRLLSD